MTWDRWWTLLADDTRLALIWTALEDDTLDREPIGTVTPDGVEWAADGRWPAGLRDWVIGQAILYDVG